MSILRRRRATEHSEVDTEGSWAISYGDMITLLLTFFILFFSTDKEKDRMQQMDAALISLFDNKLPPGQEPAPPTGPDQLALEKIDAKIHKLGNKMIVEFPNVSFFELGAIELNQDGRKTLRQFMARYIPYAGNYVLGIRAYTDNKKVINRGFVLRFSDNLELSALRAIATMRYLQKIGMPLERMRLGGYGELKLTAQELSRAIASTPDYRTAGIPLARKVVLIVEPEVREKL